MTKKIKIEQFIPSNPPGDKSVLEITNVIREAFVERTLAGINFGCANIDSTSFREQTHNSYIFIALDGSQIVGTLTLVIKESGKFTYGYNSLVAVLPSYKRSGIAAMLFSELKSVAKSLNLDFITSNTSVDADSSVKWHLKNGFKIYAKTPYSEYSTFVKFIMPLNKMKFINSPLIRVPLYYMLTTGYWFKYKLSKR